MNQKETCWYERYEPRIPELRSLAVKECLWNQFCEYIRDVERDSIRRQIGEKIISDNEVGLFGSYVEQ